jgi:hypothetical protein
MAQHTHMVRNGIEKEYRKDEAFSDEIRGSLYSFLLV